VALVQQTGPREELTVTDPTLRRLSALAKTLNEASDLISKEITYIEAALNALRLGVWAWVDVQREQVLVNDGGDETKQHLLTRVLRLGYTKHKGDWQLVASDGFDELDDEIANVTPLREAKREIKLAAVEKIPELLKTIENKVAKVTNEATTKAAQVKAIALALGKDVRDTAGGSASKHE
jgi:hypothetical protein